ncbi:hypothetical protein EC968_004361 [Mortierella alpina]|nr:hypothetical protein EC968_004361 [Mortierella alpina]
MDNTINPNDAAYLSMLTRNIPGVGNTPLNNQSASTPTTSALLTNNKPGLNTKLTTKQTEATHALETAASGALFVSEGDEPFQLVHIDPHPTSSSSSSSSSLSSSTSKPVGTTASSPALPTETEFLSILKKGHLLAVDDDDDFDSASCERSFDLQTILSSSNPGADKICKALQDVFLQDPLAAASSASPALALYRVTLPSSETRVHLWILGWVDHHLLGYHTVSIET